MTIRGNVCSAAAAFAGGNALCMSTAGDVTRPKTKAAERPVTSGAEGELAAADLVRLIEQAQSGCHEAFGELVAQHEGRVFHFLRQMIGNGHDAEDLTQVTFVKAYRGLGRFNPRNSFAGWLFTIARRSALNHVRSFRPVEELDADAHSDGRDPAMNLAEQEAVASVWRLARRLKPNQYQALWLRFGEGFSIEETARIMRTNTLHVRVLLHRGRAKLGKWITERRE